MFEKATDTDGGLTDSAPMVMWGLLRILNKKFELFNNFFKRKNLSEPVKN